MNKFTKPIDYEKYIEDVVKVICDYYKGKIAREAHRMSKEQYEHMVQMQEDLVVKSKMDCFWKNATWYGWKELLDLSDIKGLAERFFEMAKMYKDMKAQGLVSEYEEERLAEAAADVKVMALTHSRLVAGIAGTKLGRAIVPSWLFASHVNGK